MVDLSTLSGSMKSLYLALVKSKVAIAFGLPAEAIQLFEAEYERKLARARAADLNGLIISNTDPILAELVQNFKVDDPALATAVMMYQQRVNAVKANSEETIKDLLGITELKGYAKDAAISLSVSKLAGACGLDANFVALKKQEFEARLADARKEALERNADDEESSQFAACAKEVKAALGVDELDDLGVAAAKALVFVRYGAKAGYDANFLSIKETEYAAKIQEARKLKLNEALSSNDDPILAELLANFRSDDSSLVNAFDIYTKRSEMVKDGAEKEIQIAHDWTSDFTKDDKDHIAYPAFEALCAAKLVISCGLTGDAAKLYEARYQAKLRAARIKDLEDTEIGDPIAKDVFALIRGNFTEEAVLPRSIEKLTEKIEALSAMAKKDILSSHDWSFAQTEESVMPSATIYPDQLYPYHADLPFDALIVSAVYGPTGRLAQWKIRGKEIHAKGPISRIVYVRNVEDFAEWSPKVYRAFILRLVADVNKAIGSNPKDRQYQEQLARDALEDAKACDAKDANTPDEAWGANSIAETMLYGGDEDPLDRR